MKDRSTRGRLNCDGSEPRPHLLSERAVLSITFGAFATVICGLLMLLTASVLTGQVKELIRNQIHDDAFLGAGRIDAALHNTLQRPEQEGGAAYRKIQASLQEIQRGLADVEFVYTMRMDGQGRIIFVVDEETNAVEVAHLGEVYSDASPLLREHFADLNAPLVEEEPYTDRWGTWFSGYAPFYTADGNRAGVLGMDIKAGDIAEVRQQVFRTAGIVYAVSLPFCALLGWFLAGRLMGPVRKLISEACGMIRWWPRPRAQDRPATEVRELGEAIRKLAYVMDGIQDSVIATDMAGTIVYCNAAACRLLSRKRENLLGQSVKSLGENSSEGTTQEEILRATQKNGSWHGEIVNRDAQGMEVILESRTELFRDEQGTPLGMVGISTDITERNKAEEELKKHTRQLEHFNKMAVGRELRMIELKKEINKLCRELGRDEPYSP